MPRFDNRCQIVAGMLSICIVACAAIPQEIPARRADARTVAIAAASTDLDGPPGPVLSSNFPRLVPQPPDGLTPEQERPWFDTFSWQEFLALNWPALENQRGVPKDPNNSTAFKAAFASRSDGEYPQVVWGSWKQAYELFEQGSVRPTPWAKFDAVLPCTNPAPTPPKTFLDATRLDINQSFAAPLIDQKRNYTRYEIRINEPEYRFIRGQDSQESSWLYLSPSSSLTITFPTSTTSELGAVEVKAAWKLMTPEDDMRRYYVVNALVLVNPQTKEAAYQKMGLVGFHIGHKTSPFSEWVWSTFEQVDNVSAPSGVMPSYNNGTPKPATPNGFDVEPPFFKGAFAIAPSSVQVTRVNAIPTSPPKFSTVSLNAAFQKLVAGTVWQNYELIATQWPTDPPKFKVGGLYPDDCGIPFPNAGVANTVIETYDQLPRNPVTGNSCMQCHYLAAMTDFSWVLALRRHDSVAPANQAQFLASGRFAASRTRAAVSNLKVSRNAKAAAFVEALKSRQVDSQ